MNQQFISTEKGIIITIYAFDQVDDDKTPRVFLSLGKYPLAANTTMSPDEARAVAVLLMQRADDAEQIANDGRVIKPGERVTHDPEICKAQGFTPPADPTSAALEALTGVQEKNP